MAKKKAPRQNLDARLQRSRARLDCEYADLEEMLHAFTVGRPQRIADLKSELTQLRLSETPDVDAIITIMSKICILRVNQVNARWRIAEKRKRISCLNGHALQLDIDLLQRDFCGAELHRKVRTLKSAYAAA